MKKLIACICIAVIAVCAFSIFDQIRNIFLPDQVPVYRVSDVDQYLKGDQSVQSVSYVNNQDKKPLSDMTAPILGIIASIIVLIVIIKNSRRPGGESYRKIKTSDATNVSAYSAWHLPQPVSVWAEAWDEINRRKPNMPTSKDVFSNLSADELLSFLQSKALDSLYYDTKAIIHSGKYYDEITLWHMFEENKNVFPIPLDEIEEFLTYDISLQDVPLYSVKISLVGTIRAERLVYTDYHGRDPRVFGEPYIVKPEDTFTVTVNHYQMQTAAAP